MERTLDLDPSFEQLPPITDEVRRLSDPFFGPISATPRHGLGNLGPLLSAVSRVVINDDSVFEPDLTQIEQVLLDNPLGSALAPSPQDWEAHTPDNANDLRFVLDHVDTVLFDAEPIYAHADALPYMGTDTPADVTSSLSELALPQTQPDDFDLATF